MSLTAIRFHPLGFGSGGSLTPASLEGEGAPRWGREDTGRPEVLLP